MGFLQLGDEVASGHLDRFLRFNLSLFDSLAVYCDGVRDGSDLIIREFADVFVSEEANLFRDEQKSRQQLLNAIRSSKLQPDWLLWLDADEVLYSGRTELEALCAAAASSGHDAIAMPHTNLWKSPYYFRTDNFFDDLQPIRLWKWSEKLSFSQGYGLHQPMHPRGLRRVQHVQVPHVVHYGFASTQLITSKYLHYERAGQYGPSLNRLRDEKGLSLRPLSERNAQLGARGDLALASIPQPPAPTAMNAIEWEVALRTKRTSEVTQARRPLITVISLIFASIEWLEFSYGELLALQAELGTDQVEILIVANDPTPDVAAYLIANDIPHEIFAGRRDSNEWYINSVYRAYNYGVQAAQGDYVLLVNSDMAFPPGFLSSLMRRRDASSLLVGRLVERGVLRTGTHGIEKSFGSSPKSYKRSRFERFVRKVSEFTTLDGGLYMPLLAKREVFLDLGGYPEGNVPVTELAHYLSGGSFEPALPGDEICSGDTAFFMKAKQQGVRHLTAFDAVCYHFQEGELRASRKTHRRKAKFPSGISVVNDLHVGVNEETVLWGELSATLRERGLLHSAEFKSWNESSAVFWRRMYKRGPLSRVSIANASFSRPVRNALRRVVLLQDQLQTGRAARHQLLTLDDAHAVITNSANLWANKTSQPLHLLQVPLQTMWHEKPLMKDFRRSDRPISAMFVGAFDNVKGWGEVRYLISAYPEIEWIIVSKKPLDDSGLAPEELNRIELHRGIHQTGLRDLLRRADVFVLGSPFETQCLAALEAASQGVAIAMHPTGLLGTLGETARTFGEFQEDLSQAFFRLITRIREEDPMLSPESAFHELSGILSLADVDDWVETLRLELRRSFLPDRSKPSDRRLAAIRWRMRRMKRMGEDLSRKLQWQWDSISIATRDGLRRIRSNI